MVDEVSSENQGLWTGSMHADDIRRGVSIHFVFGVEGQSFGGFGSVLIATWRPGGSLVRDTTLASMLLCMYLAEHDFMFMNWR